MNTVKFIVTAKRGEFIKKEFEGRSVDKVTFEVREEQDGTWMYVEIPNFGSMDALRLFHAGVEAGEASMKKEITTETVEA